ncbi:MAG: hypothetical protein IK062_03925 [Selenomonadaceae bacterium]|nr:hypothetical protein [Selenomonadaceae bacterium]
MDKNLMSAVAEKNLTAIKTALTSINLKDRNFSTGEFEEGLKYVESQNISGLYDTFDGETFKPESEWDQSYWTYINVSLMDNFCRERIEELKKVGRKIYPVQSMPKTQPTTVQSVQKENQSSTTPQHSATNQTRRTSRRSSESPGLSLPLKVVGAAVVTGAGFIIGGPTLGVGIAVAAGGAIAWTSKNQ